jgi:glycolate oxidase iron-sulfur subunit
MKTTFTAIQLQQKPIRQAQAILTDCVHYGFCTNTCPTYVLTRDENDAPRGRIDLMRAMLEKGGAPDPRTVYHLDRCLSCLTCKTSCAVKVDYMHLIDIARDHIERHYRRPFAERIARYLVAKVIPYARRFRLSLRIASLLRPFANLLPQAVGRLITIAPERVPARDVHTFGEFAPPTPPRFRVAILAGCAQQVIAPEINAATIRVLNRHGCTVLVKEDADCCGALTLHMGKLADGMASARRVIDAWSADLATLDAIVANASGCGTVLKDYARIFEDDPEYRDRAEKIAAKVYDVTEFLQRIGLRPPTQAFSLDAVYHDACSLRNAQGVVGPPRALLSSCGFTVHDTPEGHFCCGSAGTYNLFQPQLADALGKRKSEHLKSTGAQFAVVGNIGCLAHLQRFSEFPIVHTVQVLDWATGGPAPEGLAGLKSRPRNEDRPTATAEALW